MRDTTSLAFEKKKIIKRKLILSFFFSDCARSHAADDYRVKWSALAVFQISSLEDVLEVVHLIFNGFDSSFSFTLMITIPVLKKNQPCY